MRPTDVVALRASLVDRLARPDQKANLALWLARLYQSDTKEPNVEGADFELGTLTRARLYFVTNGMRQLLVAAAQTVPSFDLDHHDVPAEDGFVVFDELVEIPFQFGNQRVDHVRAISWGSLTEPTDNRSGLAVTIWCPPDDFPALAEEAGLPPLVPSSHAFWWIHENWNPSPDTPGYQRWPAFIATFFRLIAEPYVATDVTRPDRAAARRAQRNGLADPAIRIVTLRRPAGTDVESDGGVRWSKRWLVQGHWRQQWYPSQERHAPRWIKPYVKGPADKPLSTPETVNVWTR